MLIIPKKTIFLQIKELCHLENKTPEQIPFYFLDISSQSVPMFLPISHYIVLLKESTAYTLNNKSRRNHSALPFGICPHSTAPPRDKSGTEY